jgi:hypothetical protein
MSALYDDFENMVTDGLEGTNAPRPMAIYTKMMKRQKMPMALRKLLVAAGMTITLAYQESNGDNCKKFFAVFRLADTQGSYTFFKLYGGIEYDDKTPYCEGICEVVKMQEMRDTYHP